MHALELELPMSFVVERAGPIAVADCEWLQLDVQTPVAIPYDLDRWRLDRIRLAEPASSIRVQSSFRGRSPRGWPIELIDAIVIADNTVVATRLVANYEMLGHVASLTAHIADRATSAKHLQSLLLPLIASARPVWRPESPVALAELWSLRQSAQ